MSDECPTENVRRHSIASIPKELHILENVPVRRMSIHIKYHSFTGMFFISWRMVRRQKADDGKGT